MKPRRMVLIEREELEELAALASAAVEMHLMQTHFDKCDVCDLVAKWKHRLQSHAPVCVTGLKRRRHTAEVPRA